MKHQHILQYKILKNFTFNYFILFFLYLKIIIIHGSLCGNCNNHGVCDLTTARCSCFAGFTGYQCELRLCPVGTAWADYAIAIDTAHSLMECSNMGICDRLLGKCICNVGFEGIACERMSCPTTLVNGKCINLKEASILKDDRYFLYSTTYTLWDSEKIYGSQCDFGFTGYNCAKRLCPNGDDPMTTGQVNEIQHLNCLCNLCSGSFILIFRGEITKNISPTDTPAMVATAINSLRTINGVTVTLSGSGTTICDSNGAVLSITFSKNPGDLPSLQIKTFLTGGTSAVSISSGGLSGLYDSIGVSVDGTREEMPCSNRGVCDTTTGTCTCQTGFTSSDGAGASGTLGDCGLGTATACPISSSGNLICGGKGTCNPVTWKCTCQNGYYGADCTKRICPMGYAWFDEPTATDTAHALAECSNKGSCDSSTGFCICDTGFSGSACEKLNCPGTTSVCNGRGVCKTMQNLALASQVNGVFMDYTYGTTPNNPSTWDYNKIQGCQCSTGYYAGPYVGDISSFSAYDCSLLTCPFGTDPETIQSKKNEKQTISCQADGGSFTLKFREQITSFILFSATASDIKTALEALSTITTVNIVITNGLNICGSLAPSITNIEFTYEFGDVPILSIQTTSLTLTTGVPSMAITELIKGTKENIECSGRGLCDRIKGICSCYNGYLSSDGNGNYGTRGDCGYRSPYATIITKV